ncbi:MAG: 50S ribosomal protein L11 methyltransferase [Chloroflexi bacterium]|nr:50S ribosomal protein L11 methyltransferase [Chloroflexota bacterium]
MPPDWLEVAVQVAAADAELVADVLQQRAPAGVAIEEKPLPAGDNLALVKAYLPDDEQSAALRRSLRLALRFLPLSSPARWRRPRRLRQPDWQEAWKRYFRPARIGRRLVVKPSWADYPRREGDVVIEIDPGAAFGTGQHATTALCLRVIAANVSGLTVERLAPLFARALAPGGRLVASGFLEEAAEGLSRGFEANGLAVERVTADGLWRAIIAAKR